MQRATPEILTGSDSPAEDEPNTFAAQSADGTTSITGFPNEGVFVEGSSGPACSFSGYLVENVAPSS